ncbi:molecular chaperone HtpG [candidate division WOR-3 bacterium]|nr:molecular chaperone HtpG [candidate division WOR-3 bacterium]
MQKHEFRTETKKLLDIVVHSLYSKKDIFLRELISNSSDAINKLRFLALTEDNVVSSNENFNIEIIPDRDKNTLTIKDNGIGMTRDEIDINLGTIARSGTRNYLEGLSQSDLKELPDLIGKFGVGFYSAFMVADKIEVRSKGFKPDDKGVFWTSNVDDYTYEVSEIDKTDRGTEVILHLKESEKEFLEDWKISELVKKYSDFVEYPITLNTGKEKKKINSQKALWQMKKDEIEKKEYDDFYKSMTFDFKDPLSVVHYKAEGTNEFTALAFIPSEKPPFTFFEDMKSGMNLYINRIQVLSHSEELLPHYLKFVSGIIDSSDLPLNISREMLQENRKLMQIKQNLTKKILGELESIKKERLDRYVKFFENFGNYLKEGAVQDASNREKLLELLIFHSSSSQPHEFTDLIQYTSSMLKDQKEIYYLVAESDDLARKSPVQEMLKSKGFEILYLEPGIDELLIQNAPQYKNYEFCNIAEEHDSQKEENASEDFTRFKGFIEWAKDVLKDDVKDVKLSDKLLESPACLTREKGSYSFNLEKALRDINKGIPASKPIFEINPKNKIINNLLNMFEKDRSSLKLNQSLSLLFDLSLMQEGSDPRDVPKFADNLLSFMS